MLDSLILSDPGRRGTQGVPRTLASVLVHGVAIWAGVLVTSKPEQVQAVPADPTIIVLPWQQLEDERPSQAPRSPHEVPIRAPQPGYRPMPLDVDVPVVIPPIALKNEFDPRDNLGIGVEGSVFEGFEGRRVSVDSTQPFLVSVMDEAPERIGGPTPRYPDLLREAGTEGTVILEFVIDATGRVEPGSIVVVSASHRAFEGPARDATLRSRYRPGRIRGEPVRARVRQSVAFTIR